MPATKEATTPQRKKFQGGERHVPHSSQKAKKYYPTEDEKRPKKVRKTIRPHKPRESLQPGHILILLSGRYRGKRVVFLKHLPEGILLITGPMKVNGVPLRRVNARYVIATKAKVGLKELDHKLMEKVSANDYWKREKSTKSKKDEEVFFKQGEKSEPKKPDAGRVSDQKSIDKTILASIKKENMLSSYLATSFALNKGDRPHEMTF